MASPNFAKKNPFMGMTVAQMKKYYDNKVRGKKLKAKDLKVLADQMQAAKKAAPKSKAATKSSTTTTKSSTTTTAKSNTGSGVHGQFRKVGDPGPNVTKPYGQLDRSGARVRRNQQDARRSRTNASSEVRAASGSRRRNEAAIKAEVARSSGGSRESQRAKERRQRLARERAARRNRLNLIARRNNDM